MFKMIVAHDNENGIGKNNKLPWNIPDDLRRFSKLTRGKGNNAIIMGRKTYESIGSPLPKRTNIVLSKTMSPLNNGVHVFSSKDALYDFLEGQTFDDVWVIGGSQVYKDFFSNVKELYVTEIKESFGCDTFFISEYEEAFSECIIENDLCDNGDYKYSYKKYILS